MLNLSDSTFPLSAVCAPIVPSPIMATPWPRRCKDIRSLALGSRLILILILIPTMFSDIDTNPELVIDLDDRDEAIISASPPGSRLTSPLRKSLKTLAVTNANEASQPEQGSPQPKQEVLQSITAAPSLQGQSFEVSDCAAPAVAYI